jgi:hypothetical protein
MRPARPSIAISTRFGLGFASARRRVMLDVDVSEFESVYSGAVKATDRVVIGGETKTALTGRAMFPTLAAS